MVVCKWRMEVSELTSVCVMCGGVDGVSMESCLGAWWLNVIGG